MKNVKVKQPKESPKKIAVQFDFNPAIRGLCPTNNW